MRIEGVIIVSSAVLFSINGMVTNLKSGNKSYFYPAKSLMNSVGVLIQGFDEFMNLVMDEAQEVYQKQDNRRQIG